MVHLLHKPINPVPFIQGQPDWIFWVFLTMAILIAWIQVTDYPRFRQLMRAMFSRREMHLMVREGFALNNRIFFPLGFLYVGSIAMIVLYFINDGASGGPAQISAFHTYLIVGLAIIGFWAIKIFIMHFLSYIFRTDDTNNVYILNILVSISFLGIVLFPLLIIGVYLKSEWVLFTCLIIIGLISLFRIWKGFLIGITMTRFPQFFLFVYLCSLELLPILILAKLILSYM